jgi:DNA-binding LytR/AlgR family response regulator
MKISTCIIVEDEPLAEERLTDYIEKMPGLKLVAVFDNGTDALAFLQQHIVDIIFLDIHMEGISGIRLLEEFDIKSQVILTTAYHEFAIKGFDLNVTDYLLKPFHFERFRQAVEKAEEQSRKNELPEDKPYVYVKTEYRLEKVMFADIFFIEGMRDYRKIHTRSKPIMTLQTFRDFEKEIPVNILCRVHKSYMVAIDKIDSIEKNEIRIGEKYIPISDTYRQAFYEIITRPKE